MSTTPFKYEQFPSLRFYDRLRVPYVLFSAPWEGPLWTGHCMMLSTVDGYGDAGFFHELCHWIEATPAQRRWPDFALGKQVNAKWDSTFTSSTTPKVWTGGVWKFPKERNVGWGERTILLEVARKQESNACTALWYYEPIVGLTSWDAPPANDKINSAAYEFNDVGSNMPKTAYATGLRKIVKALDLDWNQVVNYGRLVRAQLREID